MRNAFIAELVSLARQNPRIFLIVGDLGYSVVEPFADAFPDRFINAGVAEQNMTGLAAGMASEGYHVFTYSIANFPTFRCAEFIRNDVAYHNLPVTVVAVGGGLAYGALGYSHHAVQDYALMRGMPNMRIAAPGDPMEVRACVRYLVGHPGPSYLRIGKAGEPNFHPEPPDIQPGRWLPVKKGEGKRIILATGAGLALAMEWINHPDYRDCGVYTLPVWSLEEKSLQAEQLQRFTEVFTLEDHLYDGGFGSWMLEAKAMNPTIACRVTPVALSANVCGAVGSQSTLNQMGGIVQPPTGA
jgi:transketolase